MAENTFEDRLTRLEEEFKALQALTLQLAAWETGGTGKVQVDTAAPRRAASRGAASAGSRSDQNLDDDPRREHAEGGHRSDR